MYFNFKCVININVDLYPRFIGLYWTEAAVLVDGGAMFRNGIHNDRFYFR